MSPRPAPDFSVVVPCYNHGRYVAQTIEALLGQTTPPTEIVVSENHSSDHSLQVISQYSERVRLVRPPHHLAGIEHFNFAVSQTNSRWFSLVCSDDVPLPNFVSSLTKESRRRDDTVLVKAGFRYVNDSLKTLRTTYLARLPRNACWPKNFLSQLNGPRGSLAAMAIRRDAFDLVGGFDLAAGLPSDWQLQLDLAPLGCFTRVFRPVTQYRSDHHPQTDIERLPTYFKNFAYMFSEAIPRVARDNGIEIIETGELREAARSIFEPRLAIARVELDRRLFDECVDTIRPALAELDLLALLDPY